MVVAMADMALLRTPTSPLLTSSVARAGPSSRALTSATNLSHIGGLLSNRSAVDGQAHKRAGWVHLRSKVCCVRGSVGEDQRDDAREPQFPPPGELQYFGKLSAGCVAGALLVKYGSLCVPSVTIPNINVALLMITTPCLVSAIVLAIASVLGSDGNTRKQ